MQSSTEFETKKVMVLALSRDRVFRLSKDRVVIGSMESADVVLGGMGVAPIHAVLERSDPPVIYDLASESGVYVNGAKVITVPLHEGDQITIGQHMMVFKIEEFQESVAERAKEFRQVSGETLAAVSPFLSEDLENVETVFDYKPTQKQALEVVMSWHETILDVEHFVNSKAVTLGSKRGCDFVIPPLNSGERFSLIEKSGNDFLLNLGGLEQSLKATGVIQRKGEMKTLEQLSANLGVEQKVSIQRNDFAKISFAGIGSGISFYLSFTDAPPRLKRGRLFDKDPLFLRIFFSSLLLTALIVTVLLQTKIPQNFEAEQIPERVATILFQTEKLVPPTPPPPVVQAKHEEPAVKETQHTPPPAKVIHVDVKPENEKKIPVPKEMVNKTSPKINKPHKLAHKEKPSQPKKNAGQASKVGQNEAKEGAGAKAKGAEGTRGSKAAKSTLPPQNKALRPSPQGGQGSGGGNSEVADQGNVDLVKGALGKIQNILGNSASHLGKGGEQIKGFGGFDTKGGGGLALSGKGLGGGGNADTLAGGLSDHGRGGGKIGTGLGAAGRGTGIIGGMTRVPIRTENGEDAMVMGVIDADAIAAAMRAHEDEFRYCYEKEINAEHPKIAGRVGTSFVINPSGHVTQAGIASSSLNNSNVEGCILSVIRRIQFPLPKGAGVVQVTYPFKFNPVGGG